MDIETADRLRRLNRDFYREQAASFAETRQAPWPGWEKCLTILREADKGSGTLSGYDKVPDPLSVFDLACGNLRFEAYLASALPATSFAFHAVDCCDTLLPSTPPAHYQHLDILDALSQSLPLNNQFTAPACDLSVTFGFLHHVALPQHRAQILSALIDQTKPGGLVIVSLWQFLNDPARLEKAQLTHTRALQELGLPELDEGDYVLGWKDLPGAYRYCHSFSESEIEELVVSTAGRVTPIARFTADGRTGNLNTYLIFKTK
ncbi:MAG: class I SAM-dependent methyltransferase [Coriobacteriia bacterium]|nr:class I SAM-dependent methyltransferase [Coriobacteriia bacterium]